MKLRLRVTVDYGGCCNGRNSRPPTRWLESGARAEQASRPGPSPAPPPQAGPRAAGRAALHRGAPKAPPPYDLTGVPRQSNRAQMKEQSKTPERELSCKEIANLSDGEFKALVIKMLTELIELD